jgi:protocatechuate 3,4-dioxygenase beta subunit
LLLFLFVSAVPAFAQNNKGTIVGTVKDPSGAVVAGATVTVTNTETGEAREATTGDDGTYTVPSIDPGQYRVEIVAPGFQTVVRENVTLETNARLPLDAI